MEEVMISNFLAKVVKSQLSGYSHTDIDLQRMLPDIKCQWPCENVDTWYRHWQHRLEQEQQMQL